MYFNYKLYFSFFISTTFHLVLVVIFSLITLSKIPLPEKPLEIEIVEVKAPPPVPRKIKKTLFKKTKRTERVSKKPTSTPRVVPEHRPRFQYTQSESEKQFFSETTEKLAVRRIKEGHELNQLTRPLLEEFEKLNSFKEQKRPKIVKLDDFGDSGILKEDTENSYVPPNNSIPVSSQDSFEKIVWEDGINRKRIYAPPPESSSPKTGKVVVLFWVDRAGFVSKTSLRKKLSFEQNQVALNYVRKFKFEPDYSLKQGERHKGSISILFERAD